MVATQEEAVGVLLEQQRLDGCIPTQPAWSDTELTEAGWAFFNINGYLGTVTFDGEVIAEPGIVEAEAE
jgi:hypothetical protein